MTGSQNPFLFGWQTIRMPFILTAQPFAISHRLAIRNIHNRIIFLTLQISKSSIVHGIFLVGNRCVCNISILCRRTSQHQPLIIRIIINTRIYKTPKLLFQADITILNHLINNILHLSYQIRSFRFTLQLAKFSLFSSYHLIILYSHLLHQSLLIFISRTLLISHQHALGQSIKIRAFVFNKRSVNISKFQFTLYQIQWSNKLSNLNFLVYTEISSHIPALINREAITSIQITRESNDIIVFSRC